jgi:hypothetical protein
VVVMEHLPKIVRERLQATAKPEVHPDPDLLTAFAEKSLSERERGPVLEHLSKCAECREVVSLSLPEMELEHAAVAAVARPARSRWLRGRLLGWGTLAACAVIVAGIVLSYRGQRKKTVSVASKEEAVTMLAAESGAKTEAAIPKDETTAKLAPSRPPQPSSRSRADVENSPVVAEAMPPAKQRKKEAEPAPLVANQVAADQVAADQVATKAGSQSGAGFGAVAAASGGIAENAGHALAGNEREVARSAAAQVSAPQETAKVATGGPQALPERLESKPAASPPPPPAVTLDSTAEYAQHTGGTFQGLKSNEVVLRKAATLGSPRWTVSQDGTTLMRSLDEGKTWQVIRVTPKMVFRAVASVGPQVWVGGTGGALYHSSDAGEHWRRMKPTYEGGAVKADIVSLDFTDGLHGKLGTAEGVTWTTSDGGRTWQKK